MSKTAQIKQAQELIKKPNNLFFYDLSCRQKQVREDTKILALVKDEAISRFKEKNLLIFKPFKVHGNFRHGEYNGNSKKIERESARVDTKKLKDKYPDIYTECLKASSSIIIETNFEIV